MKDLNRDKIDFGSGDIASTFTSILGPTLLGLTFSAVFLLTDGIFVGNGIGSDGLAAVNIVSPIFTLETGIGMMFAIGASVAAAIHLARNNVKAARIIVTQAYLSVLLLGALLATTLYLFPEPILKLLGANEALMAQCREYYLWFAPCGLFVMMQLVAQFIIRLDGSPKFASLVEIIPACFNLFLDWLFIFPCQLGLKGAALATSIGSFTGVLMALWYTIFRRQTLSLYKLKRSMTSLLLSLRNIWHMMKIGFSGFLSEFSMSVLTLAGNYAFMRMLGEDGVAAFCIACYIAPVVYMVCAAIAQSAQPIISFNYGKGDWQRVRKTLRISMYCAIAFGLVMSLALGFFAKDVLTIFLERGGNAYNLCAKGFPLYAVSLFFLGINVNAIGYYQSIEQTLKSTVFTLMRGIAFPVAAFIVLPRIVGEMGLWAAIPVSESLTALIILISSKLFPAKSSGQTQAEVKSASEQE